MSILDHVTLMVRDFARARAFYGLALAPLGLTEVMCFGQTCGFGRTGKPDFWIGTEPTSARS